MSATAVPADLIENLGAMLDKARAEGAAAERAAVVEWLRSFRRPKTVDEVAAEGRSYRLEDAGDGLLWSYGQRLANELERGAHREQRK